MEEREGNEGFNIQSEGMTMEAILGLHRKSEKKKIRVPIF